jgi:hypothetical protein
MKCPICKEELIKVYKIGWVHPAYSDCDDGLELVEYIDKDDGTKLYWFSCPDPIRRKFFVKRVEELEKIEPKMENAFKSHLKDQIQEISKEEVVITTTQEKKPENKEINAFKEKLKEKSKKRKELLKIFKPYF